MKPVNRVLERLEGVRERNGGFMVLCPAHDDGEHPSLKVDEGDDGRVLLRCFGADCSAEQIAEALGLSTKDLFESRNGSGGGGELTPSDNAATVQHLTLARYAAAKRLPEPFLKKLGLSEFHYQNGLAVRIPYRDETGEECSVRFRLAMEKAAESDDRFRWRKGSKPCLYGLWRIEQARKAGYVFLVEGESDCHTLWYHDLPALGVPGASNWRSEWTEKLEGIEKVYAMVEPDRGGEAFWERLTGSPLRERLYRVELEVPDA